MLTCITASDKLASESANLVAKLGKGLSYDLFIVGIYAEGISDFFGVRFRGAAYEVTHILEFLFFVNSCVFHNNLHSVAATGDFSEFETVNWYFSTNRQICQINIAEIRN
jgi:hypothetical protein